MKAITLILATCLFFTSYSACSDVSDDPTADAGVDGSAGSSRSFNAGATIGDLVQYTINDDEGTISYKNTTTQETGSFTFTAVTEGDLTGALWATAGDTDYLVLAVQDRILASIIPVASGEQLIVGVKRYETPPSAAAYAGHYIYFHFDEDPTARGWGTFDFREDGTVSSVMYDITGASIRSGDATWVVQDADPSLISISHDGTDYTGMVLPDNMIVIDNGPGIGIDVGIEEPPTPITLAEVAGSYVSIDTHGHGTWTLDESGSTEWSWTNTHGDKESGTLTIRRTTDSDVIHFNNTFYVDDPVAANPDAYMVLLPGSAFMAIYDFGDGTVGYGFAVRPAS